MHLISRPILYHLHLHQPMVGITDVAWWLYILQVPPAELEALLITHPSIADAAVVP